VLTYELIIAGKLMKLSRTSFIPSYNGSTTTVDCAWSKCNVSGNVKQQNSI